jgi:hypothetical protein
MTFGATVDGKFREAKTVWPRCAATPVSFAAYRYWLEKGKWPDEIDGPMRTGGNLDAAPAHEQISASIGALEAEAIAWFESIGSQITTQDHADRAANYAEAFLELEKKASITRGQELVPLIKDANKVRANWNPIIDKAATNKRQIKVFWLTPSGFTIAGSGKGKRCGLTMRRFASFTDIRAFLRFLGDDALDIKLPQGIKDAAIRLARRILKDNDANVPPGVEVKEEEIIR